jgi:hypothetical protein
METFDELQTIWSKQPSTIGKTSSTDLIEKGEAHIRELRAGQLGTIAILTTLIVGLIAYFIKIGAHKMNELTVGLAVMITVIIVRIILELISMSKFKSITPDSSLVEFSSKMLQYYHWRKIIHTVCIPIIYITYIIGFSLLIPSFKANLSYGMYLYVVVSGYGFLTAFALFMVRILRKEMKLLEFLKGMA